MEGVSPHGARKDKGKDVENERSKHTDAIYRCRLSENVRVSRQTGEGMPAHSWSGYREEELQGTQQRVRWEENQMSPKSRAESALGKESEQVVIQAPLTCRNRFHLTYMWRATLKTFEGNVGRYFYDLSQWNNVSKKT